MQEKHLKKILIHDNNSQSNRDRQKFPQVLKSIYIKRKENKNI